MFVIIGAILGVLLGLLLPYDIPVNWVKYSAIAILAALDAIFGGLRAQLERKFSLNQFISSFFTNTALAALLAYLGDILGVDIYVGAVVAFSIRLFQNLSMIRRAIFDRFQWHNGLDNQHGKDV
ncbi:small basic protein [Hydrogenispora ethanolica]|jgi:small basic protein|uniref:Small basic protein n=1 Tax=Hydrogenispora ethanolica TaxID=1082276 RepID=A0A4V2QFK8_HYDET|nr:small basic family protein [Hydrogenispora ethanolica]TCL72317.1 small basic protein [Hydrogenispora ethanolica]